MLSGSWVLCPSAVGIDVVSLNVNCLKFNKWSLIGFSAQVAMPETSEAMNIGSPKKLNFYLVIHSFSKTADGRCDKAPW